MSWILIFTMKIIGLVVFLWICIILWQKQPLGVWASKCLQIWSSFYTGAKLQSWAGNQCPPLQAFGPLWDSVLESFHATSQPTLGWQWRACRHQDERGFHQPARVGYWIAQLIQNWMVPQVSTWKCPWLKPLETVFNVVTCESLHYFLPVTSFGSLADHEIEDLQCSILVLQLSTACSHPSIDRWFVGVTSLDVGVLHVGFKRSQDISRYSNLM